MTIIPHSDWTRPSLSVHDFDRFRKLAFDYCGLHIEAGKEELVASRLGKIMRRLGIPSYGAYYDHVTGDSSSAALVELIDNLTTNHTSFFREMPHFEFLSSTVLPPPGLPSHSGRLERRVLPPVKNRIQLPSPYTTFSVGQVLRFGSWRRTSQHACYKQPKRASTKRVAFVGSPGRSFNDIS